jgi:hypothetical protein
VPLRLDHFPGRTESIDRFSQRPDEQGAPQFPIGDHIDANRFLLCHGGIDGAVFDTLELDRRHLALLQGHTRVFEPRRA